MWVSSSFLKLVLASWVEPDYSVTFFGFFPVIWVFPLHFTSVKKYGIIRNNFMEWRFDPSLKREQGGWCNLFWVQDSKEKEQGGITESPIKNLWKLFYYGKKQKHFWFVNDSEYHHREMVPNNLYKNISFMVLCRLFLEICKYLHISKFIIFPALDLFFLTSNQHWRIAKSSLN